MSGLRFKHGLGYDIKIFPHADTTKILYHTVGLAESSLSVDKEIACSFGGGVIESFLRLHGDSESMSKAMGGEPFMVDAYGAQNFKLTLITPKEYLLPFEYYEIVMQR